MRAVAPLLAAIALAGVTPFASAFAQQKVMLGHGAAPNVSVKLFAAVGDIRVVGWDKDSVELSGVVPTGVKADMYGGAPQERSKGMKMFVEAPTEQSGREGKLILRVPHGARVWLKTGSADMDVTGITGGLDLNVVGGSITVHGSPKEVRAESMDGSVTIDGAPEWLRAKTATGDITMHGGADVGASTISGTIRTSGGEVERAKLESTTGTISFASGLARSASVELETHSGPIDILMQPRADVELDAATITGAIDNQWTRARPVAGREGRGMTLQTSSGMGGGRIVARSFKGTVQLRAK
jgi:Putative adhesin